MNVVVSDNSIDYNGFIKVNNLLSVKSIRGNIDYLVYHRSYEPLEEKINLLTEISNRVGSFIYVINQEESIDALRIFFLGSKGNYFNNEIYLENSDNLFSLIDSIKNMTDIVSFSSVDVLSDFINSYIGSGSAKLNDAYIFAVKDALTDVVESYKGKQEELISMAETSAKIFSYTSDMISKINEEKVKLQGMVESLKNISDSKSIVPTLPSIVSFPVVDYSKKGSILRFKEIGSCSYLSSFIMGLQYYISSIKYESTKVIFILPAGSFYTKQYEGYTWITQTNYKDDSLYLKDIVFTNFPCREVMTRLLEEGNFVNHIVVDRTKSNEKHILNSRGRAIKYFSNSLNILNKFKIPIENCISSKSIDGAYYTIPTLDNYPLEVASRKLCYSHNCSGIYDDLYAMRNI